MPLGRRFPPFPTARYPELATWARAVEEHIQSIPYFSQFSTSNGPNVLGVAADRATLGFDLASSATTLVWVKRSASTSTTGWSALSWI